MSHFGNGSLRNRSLGERSHFEIDQFENSLVWNGFLERQVYELIDFEVRHFRGDPFSKVINFETASFPKCPLFQNGQFPN